MKPTRTQQPTPDLNDTAARRPPDIGQRYDLERQGCTATDWDTVLLAPDTDTRLLLRVVFEGTVTLGRLQAGEGRDTGIADTLLDDCSIGANPKIVRATLRGVRAGDNVNISDVGLMLVEQEAAFGIGTPVAVLDETGSRPVWLVPGLSAQLAALCTMHPRWAEDTLRPMLQDRWDKAVYGLDVEAGACVSHCRHIHNVHIGREVTITGAASLINGSIINNAAPGKGIAGIDGAVDADGFLIEDGHAGGACLLRNVYIGQGASVDKRATAHDTLFFANSAVENGEVCASLAGPYTVSMHKGSLLIGALTSFMNAGSSTNFSNHMYKLGPVHWGVLGRGAKTSSGAYIMWGALIGAFSLVIGAHKHHPDTSFLPFSYLIATEGGHTAVVPGVMLRSCGLQRDAQKWPLRDRRLKRRLPLHDNICCEVLNPAVVQQLIRGMDFLASIRDAEPAPDGYIHAAGLLIKPSAIERGIHLYRLAVLRYLYTKQHEEAYADADAAEAPAEWIDVCGQVMPRSVMADALRADSPEAIQRLFDNAFAAYARLEAAWVRRLAEGEWRSHMPEAPAAIVELDSLIEKDRADYRSALDGENARQSWQ